MKGFKKRLMIFILAFILSLAAYGFIEPRMLTVKDYDVQSSQIPKEFDNLKILFITDVHHNGFFPLSCVERTVERANSLHPDLIVLGGDYVSYESKYVAPVFRALGKLQAPLGVYGVMGNHDHWEGADLCREEAQKNGIKLIDNRMLWLERNGDRMALAGIGDLDSDVCDISPVEEETKGEDYVILLSHNPDAIELIDTKNVDLMLSGHMHGGQITFFGLFAPLTPSRYGGKYVTGRYQKGNTALIVSNGVGVTLLPIRFFALPQIVEVTLRRE